MYFLLDPPEIELVFEVKRLPSRVRRDMLGLAKEHRADLLKSGARRSTMAESSDGQVVRV